LQRIIGHSIQLTLVTEWRHTIYTGSDPVRVHRLAARSRTHHSLLARNLMELLSDPERAIHITS